MGQVEVIRCVLSVEISGGRIPVYHPTGSRCVPILHTADPVPAGAGSLLRWIDERPVGVGAVLPRPAVMHVTPHIVICTVERYLNLPGSGIVPTLLRRPWVRGYRHRYRRGRRVVIHRGGNCIDDWLLGMNGRACCHAWNGIKRISVAWRRRIINFGKSASASFRLRHNNAALTPFHPPVVAYGHERFPQVGEI